MSDHSPGQDNEPKSGFEEALKELNPDRPDSPVGLLILAAIALVAVLLGGTLLISRTTEAASPSEPKVVTVSASTPASKAYPSYTPTGTRYTPQPITTPTGQVPQPPPATQKPNPGPASAEKPERESDDTDQRTEAPQPRQTIVQQPEQGQPTRVERPRGERTIVIVQSRG